MVDLTSTYMGLRLKNPIVPSASPLSSSLDNLKRMEDAGASAVTLWSLFEEQIELEAESLAYFLEQGTYSYAEALTYFPPLHTFRREPDAYVEHIQKAKQAVAIPIIASLNGISPGGWTAYAERFQQAGADAVELNVYFLPTNPQSTSREIEDRYVTLLKDVKRRVTIPVAIKLSPYFSALPHVASALDAAGADALVLFNRFYQPDIDVERLEVTPNLQLSTPEEMRLPMRWIAILYGRVRASMALTSGVHSTQDAIKAVMVGADVANVCSVLLKEGIGKIHELVDGMSAWMEAHEYESVEQMKGSMSLRSCAEPAAFERANYMKVLHSLR